MEWLTVVDRSGKEIGIKSRTDVHRDGDWHETFHCWMINRSNENLEIFLQQRSETKADFPEKFDITAAGHLTANETVQDGVREIHEELGIQLELDQLTVLGVIEDVIETENFIDREFAHTYLYTYAEERFEIDSEEVADVVQINLDDFESLISGVYEQANGKSLLKGREIEVNSAELVPHPNTYWEQVISAIKKESK